MDADDTLYNNFICARDKKCLQLYSLRVLKCLSLFEHFCVCYQECNEWSEWQTTALQDRNMVENVYRWACGYVSCTISLAAMLCSFKLSYMIF